MPSHAESPGLAVPASQLLALLERDGTPSPLVTRYIEQDMEKVRRQCAEQGNDSGRTQLCDALSEWARRHDDHAAAAIALLYAGELSLDMDDIDGACDYWERAIRRDPVESPAVQRLDELLNQENDWERLETACMTRIEALGSATPWELDLRVEALCKLAALRAGPLEDIDTAILTYREALDIDRARPALLALANLHLKRNQAQDAEQAAELFVELSEQLNPEQAQPLLERALDLRPDHEDAMQALQKLYGARPETHAKLTQRLHQFVKLAEPSPFRESARQLLEQMAVSRAAWRPVGTPPKPQPAFDPERRRPPEQAREDGPEPNGPRRADGESADKQTSDSEPKQAPVELLPSPVPTAQIAENDQASGATAVPDSLSPPKTVGPSRPRMTPQQTAQIWASAIVGMAIVTGAAIWSFSVVPQQEWNLRDSGVGAESGQTYGEPARPQAVAATTSPSPRVRTLDNGALPNEGAAAGSVAAPEPSDNELRSAQTSSGAGVEPDAEEEPEQASVAARKGADRAAARRKRRAARRQSAAASDAPTPGGDDSNANVGAQPGAAPELEVNGDTDGTSAEATLMKSKSQENNRAGAVDVASGADDKQTEAAEATTDIGEDRASEDEESRERRPTSEEPRADSTQRPDSVAKPVVVPDPHTLRDMGTVERLNRAIAPVHERVQRCYAKAHANRPLLSGQLDYQVRVNAQGSVSEVDVLDDTLGAKGVRSCGIRALRRASFPKPSAKQGSFRLKMTFSH